MTLTIPALPVAFVLGMFAGAGLTVAALWLVAHRIEAKRRPNTGRRA